MLWICVLMCLITLMSVHGNPKPEFWGFATSAMQIEGAWNISRGPTVWDTFLRSGNAPAAFDSVDVTADHYHRYKSDLGYLRTLGANMYRFSFSWARILPNCNGTINEDAIKYYSDMIDVIKASGAEPVGTLYHWDLPQACQSNYGGWTSPLIVPDFVNYASVLLERFSGKITYWLTMNEPSNICYYAYNAGTFAPNVKMGRQGQYLCGHYSILATAYTIAYAKQKHPNVKMSLPLVMSFGEPLDPNKQQDVEAGIRSMEFTGAWFLDPFLRGDYPPSMRQDAVIASLLPAFTEQDKKALQVGLDFMALNYYTSSYVFYDAGDVPGHYSTTNKRNGVDIGPLAGIEWQYVFPQGLRSLLIWVSQRYPGLKIWVSELGVAGLNEGALPRDQAVNDDFRISFLKDHLNAIMDATTVDNVPVEAVLVWSLMDNWEWQYGYGPRFGVVAVDYTTGSLERTIKKSGFWLKEYFSYIPAKVKPSERSRDLPPKSSGSTFLIKNALVFSFCMMILW